jgi:hypothetical protein
MNLLPRRRTPGTGFPRVGRSTGSTSTATTKLCATFTDGDTEVVVHPHSPDNRLPGHAQAHMVRNHKTLETIDKGINKFQGPKDALQNAIQGLEQ